MNLKELHNYFQNKKVLITGNTGFKGSWFTLLLHSMGAKIYGVALEASLSKNFVSPISEGYVSKQFDCDIRDFTSLKKVFDEVKPDIVFHLAANALTLQAYEQPMQTIETNAMGTTNLLENLRVSDYKVNGVIVTSDKCYRNNEWDWGYRENDVLAGIDPYSASKSLAEIITNSYYHSYFKSDGRVKVCTCRAGNVIGGGDWSEDRIIPDCIKAWRDSKSLKLRNPDAIRPWSFVLDVLWGYLLAAYQLDHGEINGESFNFGPSAQSEVTVRDLTSLIWKYLPGERNFEPIEVSSGEPQNIEHQYLKLSSDKANKTLAWESKYEIESAAEQTALWYHNYFEDKDNIEQLSLDLVKNYVSNRLNEKAV